MASDPPANLIEKDDKVTGIFSLPRELRDRIYDTAREEHRRVVEDVEFIFRAAVPTLRLVNRQFKVEFDERSSANTFVLVTYPPNHCNFVKFPRLALKSRFLELAFKGADDEYTPPGLSDNTLEHRLLRLEKLAGWLPEVKVVHMQVVVDSTHDLKAFADVLIQCPVLTNFTINSAGYARPAGIFGFLKWTPWSRTRERVIFAIWSRERGFIVDNTDLEKAEHEMKAARERHERSHAEEMRRLTSRTSRIRLV